MRFFRVCAFTTLLLLITAFAFSQNLTEKKSIEANQSHVIHEVLVNNGLYPKKQLLENSLSENFPYNIIIENNARIENEKKSKLVIVFSQDTAAFLDEIVSFIQTIQNANLDYSIDVLFSANDTNAVSKYSEYTKNDTAGSKTYIENLNNTENTASIIILPNEVDTSRGLFNDIIELTPGGVNSEGQSNIVPLGFFSSIINSFAKSNIPYVIKGYFLTYYRLNLIKDDYIIGTWLENYIPSVALQMNENNAHNVFNMLYTLIEEFPQTDFSNIDTNYSFLQLFSFAFFLTERFFLYLIITVIAIILFGFFNLSFVTGKHRQVHKKEFLEMCYLMPIIVFVTALFLFFSQVFIQFAIPELSNFFLLSFLAKIVLSVLFLLLFAQLQYVVKIPITGFIYAYAVSVTSIINIIIFSLVEITLAPLFIGQYIIVQFSQRRKRVGTFILCIFLMALPYLPYVVNITNSQNLLNVDFILDASFLVNVLLACFILPFQIMIIRILTRLKLWGMRLKTSKKKILKESLIFFLLIIIVIITLFIIAARTSNNSQSSKKALEAEHIITINDRQQKHLGNTIQTLSIESSHKVIRYTIEIRSPRIIPIYDANYPYDLLQKPYTAVFNLDEYPPNPLVVTFTTQQSSQNVECYIDAWIKTDSGTEHITYTHILQDNP